MNNSTIILIIVLILSWLIIIGQLIYTLLMLFKKNKVKQRNGSCPPNFYEFGENNSLCCKGDVSDWDEKTQTYTKCEGKPENICKISPKNDQYGTQYCYSNANICSDSMEVWKTLSEEKKNLYRPKFEALKLANRCDFTLN